MQRAVVSCRYPERVHQVPPRRGWGGWKVHDTAVVAAVGLACVLAVGAVLIPIIAPHIFDSTIQGAGAGIHQLRAVSGLRRRTIPL